MLTSISPAPVASGDDGGLSLRGIVDSLPTDPASIFTLLLLASTVLLVVWAGRRTGGKGGTPGGMP